MDSEYINNLIQEGLKEDVGIGDHTAQATIPSENRSKARLLVKDVGILAGMEFAEKIFSYVDPDSVFEPVLKDGDFIKYGEVAFYVECNTRGLLQAERLVLNIMQRMSGIATVTKTYVDLVKEYGTRVLDTRKTTPLLRLMEKEAVRIGGGTNYRVGLFDRIMIKDNHVDASGGVKNALKSVIKYQKDNKLSLPVTLEVRSLEDVAIALEVGGFDRIMFDNFSPAELKKGLKLVGKKYETEASGGINLDTIVSYAETGVDFISVGALTHAIKSLDLSLKIIK
jgi:nicotinate-nucleotide pyrophosphorylase (carboxylating)